MANAMVEDRHEGGVYRRIEVITGRQRRHNWTLEEKTRIVAKSLDPDANISEIARRNGVSRGLLNVWRRQARELATSPSAQAMFAAVQIEGSGECREGAALLEDKIAVTLNEILCLSPAEGRAKARDFLGSADSDLEFAAAAALGSLRREVEDEDIDLLRVALGSADPRIAGAAVRSLWQWRGVDERTLIELAKIVRIEGSVWLANELFMIFTGLGEHLLTILSHDDVKHFLRRLVKAPKLDGHWLEQLLVHISLCHPHQLADFFFKRVELAAATKTFSEFRSANHGPYAHTRLKIEESSEAAAVLQKTWAWLRENEHRDIYFQYAAAAVFNAMFMSVDDAMVALFEAKVESAAKAELALMSRLLQNARPDLQNARPDFIFLHRGFIIRFLERCRDAGKDQLQEAIGALFGSAISGVRGGPVGEPAEQDVKMMADAKEALRDISRLSPAYRLYKAVREFAETSIARVLADAEALEDQ